MTMRAIAVILSSSLVLTACASTTPVRTRDRQSLPARRAGGLGEQVAAWAYFVTGDRTFFAGTVSPTPTFCEALRRESLNENAPATVSGCSRATVGGVAPALGNHGVIEGWAIFLPMSPHIGFIGGSTQQMCEALREKALEAASWVGASPCVAVYVAR